MADLAGVLQRIVLEWPVVDRTRIAGRYDFALTWTPAGAEFGDARTRIPAPIETPNPPPYLATAMQQQLALTLDLIEAPLDVLIIDGAEEPAGDLAIPIRLDRTIPGTIWLLEPPARYSFFGGYEVGSALAVVKY